MGQASFAPLVPPGAKDACPTLRALTRYLDTEPSPEHRLRFEMAGLDLGRCLDDDADEDGPGPTGEDTCTKPMLDPTWEAKVRAAQVPGFVGPFATPFGVHFVYVHERLPASDPDSPKVQAELRASVLVDVRRRELTALLERLRRERTVRVAEGLSGAP